MARPKLPVTIARAGRPACASENDPRRRRLRRQHGGCGGQDAECTVGGIVWLPGGRRISRRGARIREAMLTNEACRSLRDPLRSHDAGQQCVDDERIGDDTADNAAPERIVACKIALHGMPWIYN